MIIAAEPVKETGFFFARWRTIWRTIAKVDVDKWCVELFLKRSQKNVLALRLLPLPLPAHLLAIDLASPLVRSPPSPPLLPASERGVPLQLPRDDPAVDVSPGDSGREYFRPQAVREDPQRGHAAGFHGDGGRLAER